MSLSNSSVWVNRALNEKIIYFKFAIEQFYFRDVPLQMNNKKRFAVLFLASYCRFPCDWPVWPSDLGYKLTMNKLVVPFPTFYSHCWRLFVTAFDCIHRLRYKFLSLWRDGFWTIPSSCFTVLDSCIQCSYSRLTIGGRVFLPLVKLSFAAIFDGSWMVAVVIGQGKLKLRL